MPCERIVLSEELELFGLLEELNVELMLQREKMPLSIEVDQATEAKRQGSLENL